MSKDAIALEAIQVAMSQPITRSEQFDIGCSIGRHTFDIKNKEYGDAIKETGVLGACVEMVGISGRLKQLVLKGKFSNPDSRALLVDLFVDMHNFANIALIMLGEDNLDGP